MVFLPQKAIKGHALEDVLADNLALKVVKMYEGLPYEVTEVFTTHAAFDDQVWQLYFDGASQTSLKGNLITGEGFFLVSLQMYVLPHAFPLSEQCASYATEYNSLLIGMKITHELSARHLKAYNDSILIVNQVCGKFDVHHKNFVPYHATATQIATLFKTFYIQHIP